jgi:baseplate J-like protein
MKQPCGCCEGVEIITPQPTANRPGLDTLTYRVGAHFTFLETMKARLSQHFLETVADESGNEHVIRPLHVLTTRSEDDPAIAMLDAWATVADTLTFYQERIANEGYLRTAKERRSILELGRLVGYEMRPGVAASVYLAFTLEKDSDTEIPQGTGAQSVPDQGQLPQVFETSEKLEARDEWNSLKVRLTRPQYFTLDQNYENNARNIGVIYFQGISTNLKPNDRILLLIGAEPIARRVMEVEAQAKEDRTKVTLQTSPKAVGAEARTDLSSAFKAVRAVIAVHLDLESFDVSPNTQMAKRVVGFLDQAQTRLDEVRIGEIEKAEASGGNLEIFITEDIIPLLEFFLSEILPEIAADFKEAEERNYTVLKVWLGSLRSGLTRSLAALTLATKDPVTQSPTEPNGNLALSVTVTSAAQVKSPFSVLTDLVGPEGLEKNPSLQPANSTRLARDVDSAFGQSIEAAGGVHKTTGPGRSQVLTDATAQLVVAFNPKLKDSLYDAWASAPVTEKSGLTGIQAFRVKAAPFGHNAPLKPIFAADKTIEGYEEWPLGDVLSIAIALRVDGAAGTSLITISRGSESQSADITLPPLGSPLDISLAGITIKITVTSEQTGETNKDDVFTFEFVEVKRLISFRISPSNTLRVTVKANDKFILEKRAVPRGPIVKASNKGDKAAALRSNDFSFVSLVSALPAPPFNVISLDAVYDQIKPESYALIDRPDEAAPSGRKQIIAKITESRTTAKADFGLAAKVTQLTLSASWLTDQDTLLSVMRDTTVYVQSESLALAEEPIEEDVCGDNIELAALYDGLKPGRWVIFEGERADLPGATGVKATELVMLAAVTQDVYRVTVGKDAQGHDLNEPLPGDKTHTTLQLSNSLSYCYKRDTLTIYGNVVKATNGETVKESLGSGDGSRAMQTFVLSRPPLTHVAAPTPAGTESSLEIRVNDILWHESDSLAGLGPNDRRYTTRTDDDDKTSVIFGTGKNGARLPTGVENVRAVYRAGIGKAANVRTGQISLLASRPLGVKSVINPQAATGGADRETRDQARRNTPIALMALDRIVSVDDYASFARTFAGIDKATAARISDGQRQLVHMTVAGADDIPIDINSDLYRNLVQALRLFGDPNQTILVDMREAVLLVISAKARLMPDYLWEAVEPKIRAKLLDTFSFEKRHLGQDVLLGEVISAIQSVEGVYYVDVDTLLGIPEKTHDPATGQLRTRSPEEITRVIDQRKGKGPLARVAVNLAALSKGLIRPARIAYLTPAVPDTLILTELI